MNGVRKLQLKIEVLRGLDQVAPLLMPEASLRTQLQILCSPAPMVSEIREVLTELETNRQVTAVRSPDAADIVKYGITDGGKAKLQELLN